MYNLSIDEISMVDGGDCTMQSGGAMAHGSC